MSSPNQLSFLPEDYLERKARRRSNVICASLFVVVMAAIGSAFTLSDRGLRDLRAQLARIDDECKLAAERIKAAEEINKKQARMNRQAELVDSIVERVLRSRVIAACTNAKPGGVSLLDFALESKLKVDPTPVGAKTAFEAKKASNAGKDKAPVEAAPPAPKKYDVSARLSGVADNDVQVAQFIGTLSASNLFKDVNLVISDEFQSTGSGGQTNSGDKLRKFQVEMMLNPNVEPATASTQDTRTAAVEIK
jgi:hypothetical protein